MAGKTDTAGVMDIINVMSFAIEFIIFTFFIFEEAMQIANRHILTDISFNSLTRVSVDIAVDLNYILPWVEGAYNGYGILALYTNNAYASYLYSTYMTREWGNIFLGDGRQSYEVNRFAIFD